MNALGFSSARIARLIVAGAAVAMATAVCAQESTTAGKEMARSRTQTTTGSLPMREFRGVWVATVANIDWPSKKGLPSDQQKAELVAIFDKCVELKMNAVVLQVRPAGDALYESKLDPWSEFLTGEMGKPPEPYYDPLKFAVDEAHKRGLELHCWFNPYRALHPSGKGPVSDNHLSKTKPKIVKQYGKHLWMDPGEKAVQDHTLNVIMDVVRRYDIDAVHMDDYFYPYKERDTSGTLIDFPDERSFKRYQANGGELERDDWRRENVNKLVRRLYFALKQEKPWVKLGISPFGIGRPGKPEGIQGFDQYAELYADTEKWLTNGWVDYFSPQLYWKIEQTSQSYPILLKWWVEQNSKKRHIWPGQFTSRVQDGEKNWPAQEIIDQINVTRNTPGATGTIHFSMKAIMANRGGIADALAEIYSEPALVPASPWIDKQPPQTPEAKLVKSDGDPTVQVEPKGEEEVWQWVVYSSSSGGDKVEIFPGHQRELKLTASEGAEVTKLSVSAVDRNGNESRKASASSGSE